MGSGATTFFEKLEPNSQMIRWENSSTNAMGMTTPMGWWFSYGGFGAYFSQDGTETRLPVRASSWKLYENNLFQAFGVTPPDPEQPVPTIRSDGSNCVSGADDDGGMLSRESKEQEPVETREQVMSNTASTQKAVKHKGTLSQNG